MHPTLPETDRAVIELLRREQSLTIAQLTEALGVTTTAVRQRLQRLMASDLVQRQSKREGRGRPAHAYQLTEQGSRSGGSNFGDLAMALWQELRAVADPKVRQGLLRRIVRRLADRYQEAMRGKSTAQRMADVVELLNSRDVSFVVDQRDGLPVLKALSCPYTELAEQDRSICAMERNLFTQLVKQPLRLQECRLDGASCCTFEVSSSNTELSKTGVMS